MTLFVLSIPLMVLAVALAVIPLLVGSHADHRARTAEATVPSRTGAPIRPRVPAPSTTEEVDTHRRRAAA